LAKEGVSEEALAAIKAPAGLDISAISAGEIALSILAQMVAGRRRPERPLVDDAID
jgi:xanthine dehydrogenase accessory factor